MSLWQAIVLGIIQGLTEFLPVSSSGHLELLAAVFDDSQSHSHLGFVVLLHFATALATVIVFRKDIWNILKNLFSKGEASTLPFALKIIVSMLPAAAVGFFFEDFINQIFSGQLMLIGLGLLFTALLLYLSNRHKKDAAQVSYKSALIMGLVQAISILPGISRSGSTIASARLLGIESYASARFSFLMVIPLIFGSIGKSLLEGGDLYSEMPSEALFGGFIAAFVFGILACKSMISFVRRSKMNYFAYYCFAIGCIAIVYSFFQ